MKYQIIALLFLIASCHKHIDPKMDDSCHLQYTTSKWLNIGESLVVPGCPDSVSITLLQRDTSFSFHTQLKMVDRGSNTSDTSWIDEHSRFRVLGFILKIENYTKTSVLLRVWYNYYY